MPAGAVGSCWAAGAWPATVWEALSWADAAGDGPLAFVLEINARLYVFLCDYYGVSSGDLTTMADRYMDGLSGDGDARFRKMVQDATDAML